MMSPSDPFDDDDDFFCDPAALSAIAAIEEKAIAASQMPKRQPYHHKVAAPTTGPRSVGARPPGKTHQPMPLNTNPRVSKSSFGWETGGKHAIRAENASKAAEKEALFLPPPSSLEESPMDVVVDEQGQYGLGSTSNNTRPRSAEPRGTTPLPGSQARREAIEAAINRDALPTRGPLSRSTSSTSAGAVQNAPPIGAARTLSRSISTGSQVFGRAGPSRPNRGGFGLPPISSQGSQTSSQGVAARRAVFELEEERRLREKTESEVLALRARLAAAEAAELQPKEEVVLDGGDDVAYLRQQLYAAKGQADTVRRNQATIEAKLNEEIDRLRSNVREMEAQMKNREQEAKQRIESMKTQAIFSNHNAIASASKARHQSQMMASQRQATPMKMASPLRNKGYVTPAPLMHSVKGKGRGTAPPPPRFDHLTNAFNITPTVSRSKRHRTDSLSPQTTPKKLQRTASPAVSPIVSPAASQRQHDGDMDIDMDIRWEAIDSDTEHLEQAIVEPPRDLKAELVYHIMSHESLIPFEQHKGEEVPIRTLVRIARVRDVDVDEDGGLARWDVLCRDLIRACTDMALTFEALSAEIMAIYADFLKSISEWDDVHFQQFTFCAIDAMRLVSSSILRFPSLVNANQEAAVIIARSASVSAMILKMSPSTGKALAWESCEKHFSEWGAGWPNLEEACTVFETHIADAIAELGETLCLADVRVWPADNLAQMILCFLHSENTAIIARGIDLFVVASCFQDNFQSILFPRVGSTPDVPVVDRVARFLSHGQAKFIPEQYARSSQAALGALFMLSKHDPDAIVLMTAHSVLVPALLMVIHRESTRLWGIRVCGPATYSPLDILLPALVLLHHLVFPPPHPRSAASQAKPDSDLETTLFSGPCPQGVDLRRRLQETGSTKEFNGVQHVFVTALGSMACADIHVDDLEWATMGPSRDHMPWKAGSAMELNTVQYLAQDLLDAVVEGPEGDQVYKIYSNEEDEPEEEVQDEAIEADEDYDEEEIMLGWAPPSQE